MEQSESTVTVVDEDPQITIAMGRSDGVAVHIESDGEVVPLGIPATDSNSRSRHRVRVHHKHRHHRQLTDEEQVRREQWFVILRAIPCLFFVVGIILIFIGQFPINDTMRNDEMTLAGIIIGATAGSVFFFLLLRDWVTRASKAVRDNRVKAKSESGGRHHHHHHHHHDADDNTEGGVSSNDDSSSMGDGSSHHHHHKSASSFEVK